MPTTKSRGADAWLGVMPTPWGKRDRGRQRPEVTANLKALSPPAGSQVILIISYPVREMITDPPADLTNTLK